MLQKELAKRLKARYDTKMDGSGWLEVSSDGDSVFWGDYSPNYEYVKEAFAVRSGLVSKDRLFSENESAYLCRCVDFTKGNCETLTYEQERQLDKLQEKLTDAYPSLEAEPPTFEQVSPPQQNM